MTEDLFAPTMATMRAPANPPWRVRSLLYVAFFGGALATTVLGVINGRRLRLGVSSQLLLVSVGICAIAGRIAVLAVTGGSGQVLVSRTIVITVSGLAVWALIHAMQHRPYRAWSLGGSQPAGLFWPGLSAVVFCGIAEGAVTFVLVAAVTQ